MIRAIIFDFDGLILETEEPTYRSWVEVYASYGYRLPFSTWMSNVGTTQGEFDPHSELDHLLNGKLDWVQVEARRRVIENTLIEAQPILPGADQYVRDARRLGYKVGLASNSPSEWVQRHLGRLGLLECFDCLCTSDYVKHIKPAPDLYLNALRVLDVGADEAVALEDSLIGVQAARNAGIFCVAVPNPLIRELKFSQANFQIESMEAMTLEQLLSQVASIKTQGAAF